MADRRAEQDLAAGGRDQRVVVRPDGRTVAGSVYLRRNGRRIWAYLRYSTGPQKTVELYLGEVQETNREANLRAAWALAHERRLAGS